MRRSRCVAFVVAIIAAQAAAQEAPGGGIAPLPSEVLESPQHRITPQEMQATEPSIYTTHDTPPAAPQPLPWQNAAPMPMKVPFGHAEPAAPIIPSGPHQVKAVPVEDVDSIEASEPAPPTPIAPEADPAKEDPAQPTELTSPIFDKVEDSGAPRKIVLRVLNKVTAQSALLQAKPGETLTFGRLEIMAEMCRVSAPSSQTDYAALLSISEHVPGETGIKKLFRGWMYASSPSVTALEHPVYDVTMVECKITPPAAKTDAKPDKKDAKKAKK